METKYLQSFVAVLEHGSFAEAARRLNLTPSALAARIRTLEDHVGTALIARAGRQVLPTRAGIRILPRARLILKEARDIRALANNDEPLGELRLGVATSTLAELTPELLARLYRLHPRLAVSIESGSSTHLYEKVVSRELDAALIMRPQHPAPKGFEWGRLKDEPLVVLAPGKVARDADPHELLSRAPFLRLDRNTRGGQVVDYYLRKHGIQPMERLEIDALATIACLVRDGVGISLVPEWAPAWLASLGVTRLALPDAAPVRTLGFFWDPHGTNAALASDVLAQTRLALRCVEAGHAAGANPDQACWLVPAQLAWRPRKSDIARAQASGAAPPAW